MRAAAKPLVVGRAGSAKCGKLNKAASDAEMTELIGGRLLVRAPSGAKPPAASAEMASVEEESRLVADGGKVSLAIVARETFQLDTDLYEPEPTAPVKPHSLDVEAAKFLKATFPSEEPLDVVPVEIGASATKMRAYAARPAHPNAAPGKDTALVLALLVARDEGELESVGFYVRGEDVRTATGDDLVGCTRLAERIASTLQPGPRKLERAPGRRKVLDVSPDAELAVTVPADYVAVTAGEGARLYKLRPLSLYPGSVSISVVEGTGGVDRKAAEGADTVVSGKLLGRSIEWHGKTTPKGGFVFASEPLDPGGGKKLAEVLVKATRQAKALDEMRGVAETLTLSKKK